MHNSHKAKSKLPGGKPVAGLFPYQDCGVKSALDYRDLARLQTAEEVQRRTAFSQRLAAFKQTDEPLRSYPTPSLEGGRHELVDLRPGRLIGDCSPNYLLEVASADFTGQAPAAQAASPAGADDDYPFEAPPLDASQYGGVEVDEQYDMGMPSTPTGVEGQPDLYDWSKATTGVVTTFGRFPYRYQKDKSKTYMIRLGTQDHWGVDLERVAREFGLQKGDKVALMCIGKQPVIVPVRVRQSDGSYKTEEQEKMRNTWVCKRLK
ncbi:hypothetical protein ACRCPS_18240 [Pseudomonas aeruginosa]